MTKSRLSDAVEAGRETRNFLVFVPDGYSHQLLDSSATTPSDEGNLFFGLVR